MPTLIAEECGLGMNFPGRRRWWRCRERSRRQVALAKGGDPSLPGHGIFNGKVVKLLVGLRRRWQVLQLRDAAEGVQV